MLAWMKKYAGVAYSDVIGLRDVLSRGEGICDDIPFAVERRVACGIRFAASVIRTSCGAIVTGYVHR